MNWVDSLLSADDAPRIRIGGVVLTGHEFRKTVMDQQLKIAKAGIDDSSVVVLNAAPGIDFVSTVLAVMRIGAQLVLLDHRLTGDIVDDVMERASASHAITSSAALPTLRGFTKSDVSIRAAARRHERLTDDPLIQLSSGTTAAPKLICRSSASLLDELNRYRAFGSVTAGNGSLVVVASIAHTWGLVGGLLSALAERAEFVLPAMVTARGILEAVGSTGRPTTVLGVPFHAEMLCTIPTLPKDLHAFLSAGAPLAQSLVASPAWKSLRVGQTYGMTETGVVSADLGGVVGGVGRIASDLQTRISSEGVLEISLQRSPYLDVHSERYTDGWLDTRDAVEVDIDGNLRLIGRVDGLSSLGGKKFHTSEIETHLKAHHAVTEAVVFVTDATIEAFVEVTSQAANLEEVMDTLPEYMRPHSLHVVAMIPRTITGKPTRHRGAYGNSHESQTG
ncbi:hypothetical protein C5C13_11750 [Clavibacter michiganensis]|nr:hypothetical protein C5C13_11750 [Clavibacter michiganensis]